jgi:hypothetical protein
MTATDPDADHERQVTLGDTRPWAAMAADRREQIARVRVDVPGAGWP